MAETIRAEIRRIREGFFDNYCRGHGIDIGCGDDPIRGQVRRWDMVDGDATHMATVADNTYDFVYSSHCIEHLDEPHTAIRNWLRICKRKGFLIIFAPHRDLYEKRKTLPSRYNPDHRTFWLPDRYEPPSTIGLIPFVAQWLNWYDFIYCKTCDEAHTITDPNQHSDGEYSIELVLRKW